MGGITQFFCAFSETLKDVANALVDTDFPFLSYGAIFNVLATRPVPPYTPESLTHIDWFEEKLKLSHIVEVLQAHHHLHLILNLSDNPDKGTSSVNDTING